MLILLTVEIGRVESNSSNHISPMTYLYCDLQIWVLLGRSSTHGSTKRLNKTTNRDDKVIPYLVGFTLIVVNRVSYWESIQRLRASHRERDRRGWSISIGLLYNRAQVQFVVPVVCNCEMLHKINILRTFLAIVYELLWSCYSWP